MAYFFFNSYPHLQNNSSEKEQLVAKTF